MLTEADILYEVISRTDLASNSLTRQPNFIFVQLKGFAVKFIVYPRILSFYFPEEEVFGKHMGVKKNNLVTSIFYFSHNVSYSHATQFPSFVPISTLFYTVPTFDDPVKEAFRNNCRKGENAGNQDFLLFSQCFMPYHRQTMQF